jgi:CelD/BcsL family acetyltransferase involved in cellulose biosynthesis
MASLKLSPPQVEDLFCLPKLAGRGGNDFSGSLEIVRTVEAFDALQAPWEALVSQMQVGTPFVRYDWCRSWWRHFGKGKSLAIAVLRQPDGEVVAIAPCVLTPGTPGVRRIMKHLTWMGGMGDVLVERMDFLVPNGREDELMAALLDFLPRLQGEWDAIWLPAIPSDSKNLPHLIEALGKVGNCDGIANIHPCRFTPIPTDWKAYEGARSSRWRRNLRNRWSTFLDEHQGRRCVSGVDMPHGEALDHLARLHHLQWPGDSSNFLRPAAWAFYRENALRWLEEERALLTFLMAGDRVVAAALGLIKRRAFSLFQQGWDPEYKSLSIGNLAVHWSLETAAGHGLETYDMLSGDCRYKAEWCPELRQTLDLEAYNPESLRAQVFLLLRHLNRTASKLNRTAETTPAEAETTA